MERRRLATTLASGLAALLVIAAILPGAARSGAREAVGGARDQAVALAIARLDSLLDAARYEEAATVAAQHARYADDLARGWQWRQRWGIALLRGGRAAAALPHLEAAVQGAPGVAENHRNLGAALIALDRPGRALAEYQQAVDLDPSDADLRLEYGYALARLGLAQDALREFGSARHLCGGCPVAERALAGLHVEAGRHEAARPHLERLLEWSPEDEWIRKSLALGYLIAERPDSAAAVVYEIPPAERDAEAWLLLASAGSATMLVPTWERLLQEPPPEDGLPAEVRDSHRFWALVAQGLQQAGRPEAALQAIDRALALEPAEALYRNNRAALLQALGREDEARRELQRAGGDGGSAW
ncbi:MAG: tetratricopeptide repeat protein [Candidatus Krumholzibacteriia bacterium]